MAYVLQFGTYVFPLGFYPAADELVQINPHAKMPRYDGARNIRGTLDARRVNIRGGFAQSVISTPGLATVKASVDSMLTALIGNAPSNLYFGDTTRYLRQAQLEKYPQVYGPTGFNRFMEVDISFLAADPLYYSTVLSSDTWAVSASPTNHTVATPGMSAYAVPSFTVTVGGGGAQAINFTILNQTTGKSFTLIGNVTGGDPILVDCLNQTVTIYGVNRMDVFDGIWPALISGNNVIVASYSSGTITNVAVSYNARNY